MPNLKALALGSILGIGAVASDMLNPEESEAGMLGNVGKFFKSGSKGALKASTGNVSSAAERLVGQKVGENTIKDVVGGHSKEWRTLVFEDGSAQTVPKVNVEKLCAEIGTMSQMNKFSTAGEEAKDLQADTALNLRQSRNLMGPNRSQPQRSMQKQRDITRELEVEPDTPVVGIYDLNGDYHTIQLPYAENLLKRGKIARIDKSKKGVIK